jgi:hypothetical protein
MSLITTNLKKFHNEVNNPSTMRQVHHTLMALYLQGYSNPYIDTLEGSIHLLFNLKIKANAIPPSILNSK